MWEVVAAAVAASSCYYSASTQQRDPYIDEKIRMRSLAEEQMATMRQAMLGTTLLLTLGASVIYTICEFAGLVP